MVVCHRHGARCGCRGRRCAVWLSLASDTTVLAGTCENYTHGTDWRHERGASRTLAFSVSLIGCLPSPQHDRKSPRRAGPRIARTGVKSCGKDACNSARGECLLWVRSGDADCIVGLPRTRPQYLCKRTRCGPASTVRVRAIDRDAQPLATAAAHGQKSSLGLAWAHRGHTAGDH